MSSREDLRFDYYRRGGYPPFPRSLATALRSYQNGQTSLEPAVFRAGSVDSIFQQPLNVHLVLDLLSNAEMDHTVNQALAGVLFDSLDNPDREIADFAAQSLARLEERYYRMIHAAEKRYHTAADHALKDAAGQDLVTLYQAFAELQRFNPMLREYYLRKALEIHSVLPAVRDDGCVDTAVPERRVRALLGIGEYDQAERELAATHLEETPAGHWLSAEIQFARRDPEAVVREVRAAVCAEAELGIKTDRTRRAVATYWAGDDARLSHP